jgi:hypothetical protein
LRPKHASPKHANARRDFVQQLALGHTHVVFRLQVQPKAGFHAEEQTQTQGGVGRDRAWPCTSSLMRLGDGDTSMSAANFHAPGGTPWMMEMSHYHSYTLRLYMVGCGVSK